MDDDIFRSMFKGFGNFGNIGPGRRDHFHQNDEFDPSFFHNDINRMFQDMEEMMKHFTFGNFNIIESPQFNLPRQGIPIEGPKEDANLRDKFLKPENKNEKKESSSLIPSEPSQRNNSFFDQFFSSPIRPSIIQPKLDRFDEDLDEKIKNEGFDKVLREDLLKGDRNERNLSLEWNRPKFYSSGQSCSIRRIQRPDGSIEEVKTVKNSDGKEEKTVTRIIGDKAHSIIEKKSNKGLEETEEIFHNFDENQLNDFNKMWENFPNKNKKDSKSIMNQEPNLDSNEKKSSSSIISKLFSWLK